MGRLVFESELATGGSDGYIEVADWDMGVERLRQFGMHAVMPVCGTS
jgi:hypothetical protein